MAQLSANSQGTAGIESGGTQSALMHLVRDAGTWALLIAQILKKLRQAAQQKESEEKENKPQQSKENANQTLNGDKTSQPQIEGTEQKRLMPGKEGEPAGDNINIASRDTLTIAVSVGDTRIEDSYANWPQRFNELSLSERQAISTAMTGGTPQQEVSISVKDTQGAVTHFSADAEKNNGWTVSDNPAENLSAQAVEEDLQRQKTTGVEKIKNAMRTMKPEGGPDVFQGASLTVFTDGDEVIVVDNKSGIIRDAERLDKIGEVGEQAVRQSAKEAAGAFGVKGSAAKGISRPKIKKQRELTP